MMDNLIYVYLMDLFILFLFQINYLRSYRNSHNYNKNKIKPNNQHEGNQDESV